ncbi:SCO6745 family protein [Gordonia sp. NPDC003424]
MTSITDATGRLTARKAYDTLEPFHVLAYFNPGLREAQADTGLDAHAFYVGARAAPMGDAHAAVVASAFYNFTPELIATAWTAAREVGLDRVAARRVQMLDDQLRTILGDRADDPEIGDLATRYAELAATLPLGGRPLAAGWAAATPPEQPTVALWHAIAVLREWRGDNHIAALVNHGLAGLDAVTFHEAELTDPTIRRRLLGRKFVQITRGWSDDDWDSSIARLVDRGVAVRTDTGHQLTDAGLDLYRTIEDDTDAMSAPAWSGDDIDDLLTRTRPYVKAVIAAGVLPGTRKK